MPREEAEAPTGLAKIMNAVFQYRTSRAVEFSDTDMEGLIHFSRFFIYMETAEHRFLAGLGSSVALREQGRRLGWPRLAVGCEFLAPVRFEDELDIRLLVLRKGRRSLTYGCEFFHRGRQVARGQSSSVCCILGSDGRLEPTDIPEDLAVRIAEAPAEERAKWKPPIREL